MMIGKQNLKGQIIYLHIYYEESITYFEKLENNSEFAQLKTIGISPQGRELKCLVVSKDKIFDPIKATESGKAVILINNGIHSGEIEGKDASMILLRDADYKREKRSA